MSKENNKSYFNNPLPMIKEVLQYYNPLHPTEKPGDFVRFWVMVMSSVVVPVGAVVIQYYLLAKDSSSEEDNSTSFDNQPSNEKMFTLLATGFSIASMKALQCALIAGMGVYTAEAAKENHAKLVMGKDDNGRTSSFLKYVDISKVGSLQSHIVGNDIVGFIDNVVPFIPQTIGGTITLGGTLWYTVQYAGKTTMGVTTGFCAAYAACYGLIAWLAKRYEAHVDTVQGELMFKTELIQQNSATICLMGTVEREYKELQDKLNEAKTSKLAVSALTFSYYLLSLMSPVVASQYIGGLYNNAEISAMDIDDRKILNIMIMCGVSSITDIVTAVAFSYQKALTHYKELENFFEEHDRCMKVERDCNTAKITYEGDRIVFDNFRLQKLFKQKDIEGREVVDANGNPVYRLEEFISIGPAATELVGGRAYKIIAPSGAGKSSFLKALRGEEKGQWEYTSGNVILPEYAKTQACFIPSATQIFIQPGYTLKKIITYLYDCRTEERPTNATESQKVGDDLLPDRGDLHQALLNNDLYHRLNDSSIDTIVKTLMSKLGFNNDICNKLDEKGIDWSKTLSNGQKQKIAIIRSILTDPQFIIMDEATSGLDKDSTIQVKEVLIEYTRKLQSKGLNYMVLYVEHDTINLGLNQEGVEKPVLLFNNNTASHAPDTAMVQIDLDITGAVAQNYDDL